MDDLLKAFFETNDEDAAREIFTKIHEQEELPLKRLIILHGVQFEAVDDILQEVFRALWEKW